MEDTYTCQFCQKTYILEKWYTKHSSMCELHTKKVELEKFKLTLNRLYLSKLMDKLFTELTRVDEDKKELIHRRVKKLHQLSRRMK